MRIPCTPLLPSLAHALALAVSLLPMTPAALAQIPSRIPAPRPAAPPQSNPNILLIVADDLGFADLGSYGQKIIRTPVLDSLAARGLRFTQFYAGSPVCAPSRCCLMTGKHGGHAFVRDNENPPGRPHDVSNDLYPGQIPIPDAEITLPELLQKAGYATAAIGKWGLGFEGSTGDPRRQGFDHFFGYLCQADAHNHYPRFLWRNGQRIRQEGNNRAATGAIHSQSAFTQEAITFLRNHKSKPFFLYLPFTIPHASIQAPQDHLARYRGTLGDDPPFVNDSGRGYQSHPAPHAGYAAMVSFLDQEIGKILDELRTLGLDQNTLILFSSDNGPTHGRVGGTDSAFFQSSGGLRGLKGSVYEGGLRVPLIAVWPGRVAPGTVTNQIGYFPDILPTILSLAAPRIPLPPGIDGLSLAPTLLGRTAEQPHHPFLFWDFSGYGGQQALRIGDWKAVRTQIMQGNTSLELYNLAKDPAEKHNIAGNHPEQIARMAQIMAREHTPSPIFPMPAVDALKP